MLPFLYYLVVVVVVLFFTSALIQTKQNLAIITHVIHGKKKAPLLCVKR